MSKRNLLIVEDDNTFVKVLTNNFSDTYNIRIANSFEETDSILEKFSPDIIFIDYFLPGAQGDAAFEVLSNKYPDSLIIVLSANDSSKTVIDLVKKGVRNYVVKDENSIEEINEIIKEELG